MYILLQQKKKSEKCLKMNIGVKDIIKFNSAL